MHLQGPGAGSGCLFWSWHARLLVCLPVSFQEGTGRESRFAVCYSPSHTCAPTIQGWMYLDGQYSHSTHVYVCLAFSSINTPLIHPQLDLSLSLSHRSRLVSRWQSTVQEYYITSQTIRKQKQRKEKKSNNAHPALRPYGAMTMEGYYDRNFDHANYANHEFYSSSTHNLSHSTSTQSGFFRLQRPITTNNNAIWPQYGTIHTISIPQPISSHCTHPPYQ